MKMKEFFSNLVLCIVLGLAMSAYTGCGGSASMDTVLKVSRAAGTTLQTQQKGFGLSETSDRNCSIRYQKLGRDVQDRGIKGKVLLLEYVGHWSVRVVPKCRHS